MPTVYLASFDSESNEVYVTTAVSAALSHATREAANGTLNCIPGDTKIRYKGNMCALENLRALKSLRAPSSLRLTFVRCMASLKTTRLFRIGQSLGRVLRNSLGSMGTEQTPQMSNLA